MIEIKNVSKSFDRIEAVKDITAIMEEGCVFGLVGTNGAGKSTLLRMIAGIIKPDEGSIYIDGEEVYENENAKKSIFYISDEQYYLPQATPMSASRPSPGPFTAQPITAILIGLSIWATACSTSFAISMRSI